MDAECPTANVQPTLEDGATPSASSHCATDARERTLARDRARRRERLAAETAEEKERRLAQRRVRDRARRASRSSPVSETRLEQWRSAEQRRRAVESSRQREARLARYRLNRERQLAPQTPEERETQLTQYRLNQESPKLYSSLHILRIQSYTHPCTSFASKAILIPAHPSHPKLYSSLHTSLHIIAHFLYSFIYLYFSPFHITEIAAAHTICPSVMHLSHSLVPGPPRNVFMYAVGSLHMWNS